MSFLSAHEVKLANLGLAILIMVVAWIVVWLMRRAVDRFMAQRFLAERGGAIQTKFRMIERLCAAACFFVAAGFALYVLDVSILRRVAVGMFASAGLVGIVLAFAAQTTAANLVSGIIISFVQPLRLGDRVQIDDEQGIVEEIGLFYTCIKTWDNRRIVVPNQLLSSRIIRNSTLKETQAPAVVELRLQSEVSVEWVRAMLLEEAALHPLSLRQPEPAVQVVEVSDTGFSVRLVAWADTPAAATELAAALRERAVKPLASRRAVAVPGAAREPAEQ